MGISLSWTESCGDTCTVFHPVAGAFGTSPVELRLDGIEVPGNRTLEISVSAWFDPTPSPLVAELHTDQAFHVEGSITVDAVPAGD